MDFHDYGIELRSSSGQEKTKCPQCSPNRRKSMPDVTRKALLKAITGKEFSEESKDNMKKAAIKRYDTDGVKYLTLINIKTGEVIPGGRNVTRLAKQLKVNKGNLISVVHGNRRTAGNWRIK